MSIGPEYFYEHKELLLRDNHVLTNESWLANEH
jgi:hypothetical protein